MSNTKTDDEFVRTVLFQALQQNTCNLTEEQLSNLGNLCEDAVAVLGKLSRDRTLCNSGPEVQLVDSQVLSLSQQVYEAESRVGRLRQEVPLLLAESMKNELMGCRPPRVPEDNLPDISGKVDVQQHDLDAAPDCPAWKQLTEVNNKVPSLMARLDQTLQRLTRIVDITEADQCRPSPRTVEKVLMNRTSHRIAALDQDDVGNEEAIAAAATRKRLIQDFAA
ncbi:hypothetical protein CEUSTIGMA_g2851.t1 [Chlamydomonas eustigma]|uniref:Uncharacterized protein n=1 Tax=Chlamydomonas eustigma TaxID=1157962 RepID=A0A250WX46_9CHLO|nr:hypothetical protein CEUSTIGMA_g2851.t1 [Chlamydomonas eustigma]|eukprot:GAX75407.1 hypothetical protein CEUSTIGMA_g2851.t1 [Chlamydomonas eustigma]